LSLKTLPMTFRKCRTSSMQSNCCWHMSRMEGLFPKW
jgi:hypothetical protein